MKAVIFDRDGVIIATEALNIQAASLAFAKLGVTITEDDKKLFTGRHVADFGIIMQKKYNFNVEELIKLQREFFYSHIEDTPLYERTIRFIKVLKQSNHILALTTAASKLSTDIILKYAGLENIFDLIVTSEDYKKRKPEPDAYIVTAEKLKESPENCIVFEDSHVGVVAAKRAGMKCIALPNEYTIDHDFSMADKIVYPEEELSVAG